MFSKRIVPVITCLLLCCGILGADEIGLPIISHHSYAFPVTDGAKNNLIQDRNGLFYVVMDDSVYTYDGFRYRLLPGSYKMIPFSLLKSPDGRVLIAGYRQIGYVDYDEHGIPCFRSINDLIPNRFREVALFSDVVASEENAIFLASRYLFIWNYGKELLVHVNPVPVDTAFFSDGQFYFSDRSIGLGVFDGERINPIEGGKQFGGENHLITATANGKGDVLFATDSDGIFHFADGKAQPVTGEIVEALKGTVVNKFEYLNGQTWAVATAHRGVLTFNTDGQIQTRLGSEDGLRTNHILNIYKDYDNDLWIIFRDGNARVHYPSQFTFFDSRIELRGSANSILRYKEDLYTLTTFGLFKLLQSDSYKPSKFKLIHRTEDSSTSLVIALKDVLLLILDNAVYSIDEDEVIPLGIDFLPQGIRGISNIKRDPNAFLLYGNGFIHEYHYAGGALTRVNGIDGIDENILKVSQDNRGWYWFKLGFGTVGRINESLSKDSLIRWDKTDGLPDLLIEPFCSDEFRVFATREGPLQFNEDEETFTAHQLFKDLHHDISKDFIAMSEDSERNIWVSSTSGNGVLIRRKNGTYYWGKRELRLFTQPQVKVFFVEDQGVVWMASNNEIIRYDKRVMRRYKRPFEVAIMDVVDGSGESIYNSLGYKKTAPIKINFADRVLRVEFAVLTYQNAAANRIQYYLEGLEEDWSGWRKRTYLPFSNLKEGDYTLHLRGRNLGGHVSDEVSFAFTILPPWHRTYWAYMSYLLGLVLFIWVIVRMREWRLHRINRELSGIVKLRTVELEDKNDRLKNALKLQMEAEETIFKEKERAEVASRAKSSFLAMMSHEIRTPLNAIVGFSQLLSGTKTEEERTDFVEKIESSTDSLLGLINDILDYSKLEAAEFSLSREPFNIVKAVKQCVDVMIPSSEEKKLNITCEFGKADKLYVLGDKERLKQVVINLIHNAIKFTYEGGIEVGINHQLEDDIAQVEIWVKDTGIGIDKDNIDKIFTRFEQVDSSTSRKAGGIGLGLSICKKTVEQMGGDIGCESEYGKGSTFRFRIQLDLAKDYEDTESPFVDNSDKELTSTKIKLLCAEDNKLSQKVLSHLLKRLGLSLVVRGSGPEVIEELGNDSYDVLLMDVEMPDMDGLEATGKIRNGDAGSTNKDIYIIGITAHAVNDFHQVCLAAGMNDYLPKPVKINQLRDALQRAIESLNTDC